MRRVVAVLSLLLLACCSCLASASGMRSPATSGRVIYGIIRGPDGAIWFVSDLANRLGRLTSRGEVTTVAIPVARNGAVGLAAGPSRSVWFVEQYFATVGRVAPGGGTSVYPLPAADLGPSMPVGGADGALWFTEVGERQDGRTTVLFPQLGRLTIHGIYTEYPVPTVPNLLIATQPDGLRCASAQALRARCWIPDPRTASAGRNCGCMWFSLRRGYYQDTINHLNADGSVLEFRPPGGRGLVVEALAAGTGGVVWFALTDDADRHQIGALQPDGSFRLVTIPQPRWVRQDLPYDSEILGLASGADGAIWFTVRRRYLIPNSNQSLYDDWVGRLSPRGAVTAFRPPHPGTDLGGIVAAAGALWFLEPSRGAIGKITPLGPITEYPV